MRYNLVMQLFCSECGTQLELTYDKKKNDGKYIHNGDENITGAAKIHQEVCVRPCPKCLGKYKRQMENLNEIIGTAMNINKQKT